MIPEHSYQGFIQWGGSFPPNIIASPPDRCRSSKEREGKSRMVNTLVDGDTYIHYKMERQVAEFIFDTFVLSS